MSKYIEGLKMIWQNFTIVTVAVMAAAASYVTIFYGAHANVEIILLWQIMLVSFLCSISQFICGLGKKEMSKKQFCLRCFGAYIYVNVVVLGLGVGFKWFDISSLPMVIGMLLAVLVAFVFVIAVLFFIDLKTTDEINRKLRERNGE